MALHPTLLNARRGINYWKHTTMATKHTTHIAMVPEDRSTDITDRLGGWFIESVGEAYGEGYHLSVLSQWSNKLLAQRHSRSGITTN